MKLAAIWRYPVKSMRGEPLEVAQLSRDGVFGDRLVQVFDRRGHLITARTHPTLLAHRGSLDVDGEPTVDGHRWDTREARAIVVAAAGDGSELRRDDHHRFDILPLLVATDGMIEVFGRDPRRLRPNLMINGVDGLREREWEGRRLQIGAAVITLEDLRGRRVMTTFDPDSQAQDPEVLRDIGRCFAGKLCLNACVDTPARIDVSGGNISGGFRRQAQRTEQLGDLLAPCHGYPDNVGMRSPSGMTARAIVGASFDGREERAGCVAAAADADDQVVRTAYELYRDSLTGVPFVTLEVEPGCRPSRYEPPEPAVQPHRKIVSGTDVQLRLTSRVA